MIWTPRGPRSPCVPIPNSCRRWVASGRRRLRCTERLALAVTVEGRSSGRLKPPVALCGADARACRGSGCRVPGQRRSRGREESTPAERDALAASNASTPEPAVPDHRIPAGQATRVRCHRLGHGLDASTKSGSCLLAILLALRRCVAGQARAVHRWATEAAGTAAGAVAQATGTRRPKTLVFVGGRRAPERSAADRSWSGWNPTAWSGSWGRRPTTARGRRGSANCDPGPRCAGSSGRCAHPDGGPGNRRESVRRARCRPGGARCR